MFCSKCGAKIKSDDKFCPKCGHTLHESKEEKKEKEAQPVAATSQNSACLSCFFIFLIFLSIFFLVATLPIYYGTKGHSNSTELIIGILLFFVLFLFLGIWGLVNQSRKPNATKSTQNKPQITEKTTEEASKTKPSHNTCSTITTVICIVVVFIVGIPVLYYFIHKNIGTVIPTQDSTNSYDGYYPTTMTKPNCDSSVELTAFSVANNAVQNPWGDDAKIGPAGKTTETLTAGRTPMVVNLTFTDNGSVSGTWSSGKCSGTFSGKKSW